MQKRITNKIQFGQKLNQRDDYGGGGGGGGVPSVDDDGNLETLFSKVDKVGTLWELGKADGDLVRYVPNVLPVTRQNQVAGVTPHQAYASDTYTDKKTLEFTMKLTANTYTNYSSIESVLPVWFVKNSAKTTQLAGTIAPVNNIFA